MYGDKHCTIRPFFTTRRSPTSLSPVGHESSDMAQFVDTHDAPCKRQHYCKSTPPKKPIRAHDVRSQDEDGALVKIVT